MGTPERSARCGVHVNKNIRQEIGMRVKEHYIDEIVKRYAAGESAAELGKAYGISRDTVYNYLRSAGVPIRARGGDHSAKCVGQKRYFIAGKKSWEK